MTTITIYQTPQFGATQGHLPVFTMEDMPVTGVVAELEFLDWSFVAFNDHERMAKFGCPSTMRSLSVGDIVCMEQGVFGSKYYVLSSAGWRATIAPK